MSSRTHLGVEVVEGSPTTSDASVLEHLLQDSDILIDCVGPSLYRDIVHLADANQYSSDDLVGAQNILTALKNSSKRTRVIHVVCPSQSRHYLPKPRFALVGNGCIGGRSFRSYHTK